MAIGAALCASLIGCRLEFAADAGAFAPSVGEVRTLLEQDRVRVALERANLLTQRYRGPEAELVHGWALWRNGDVRGAETHFRRAAEVGSHEGYAGLAVVRASSGHWDEAVRLARSALADGDAIGSARAVLASAAWIRGGGTDASRELRAWGAAEPGTARGRAATAMAAAAARIEGRPNQWSGETTLLRLQSTDDSGPVIEARIDGETTLLALDLSFRQSLISGRLAERLGLPVEGPVASASRSATPRWPALLSSRQVMIPRIEFDGLSVSNVVVAVAQPPVGADGVLGADILASARWSLVLPRGELLLAPPSVGRRALRQTDEGRAVAWLSTRLVREGVSVQMLIFPRVAGNVVAAGIDISRASRLDLPTFVVPPGDGSAPASLMLGGWRQEVAWRPASLTGWAVDGGVAPVAVLGENVLRAWALHWYPGTMQLRVDDPPLGGPARGHE